MPPQDTDSRPAHQELRLALEVARQRLAPIDRISLASYDLKTGLMLTAASSQAGDADPQRAQGTVPSARRRIDDLLDCQPAPLPYGEWLRPGPYRASVTQPVFHRRRLAALVFFDSRQPAAFRAEDEPMLAQLGLMAAQLFLARQGLGASDPATLRAAIELSLSPEEPAGKHLERRARYCRLMATSVASLHGLDDDFIECLAQVGPLHDIGMLGIPAGILHKAGRLEAGELAQMKQHVQIGELLVGPPGAPADAPAPLASRILYNIVAAHHERGDGSGYPRGLVMNQIPIEARIVAVADVYEALSSYRPYKPMMSAADIRQELMREVNRGRLDHDCVQALLDAQPQVQAIQDRFADPIVLT